MSEALKDKELQLLIALWIDGGWLDLPGEMRAVISHTYSSSNSNSIFKFTARDAKRLHKLGYVETIAPRVVMNMMTGKTHKVSSDSFRITKLGIMRLRDPKHVIASEVMEG